MNPVNAIARPTARQSAHECAIVLPAPIQSQKDPES